ncbi:MAG TPA: MoxR family ATPase [Phaeodactylibacter sp.]|nr:MoxR family ATPase [Phaeodactylibacter sp.]
MESFEIENITREVQQAGAFVERLQEETKKTIIGQEHMMQRLLIGLLAEGHILLEGLPGLAKTLAIKTLSKAVQASYHRIQFTPDLLPADIIGTMIYNQQKGEFTISKGPIFANFILADEINRAPAKVQAALLEAMQERQVTIGGHTYRLEEPFLVLATQNPIEQEGTYPLPEAQTDRFMLKVLVDYPKPEDELEIMRKNLYAQNFGQVQPVIDTREILEARKAVRKVYVDAKIEQYILQIVLATRKPSQFGLDKLEPMISYGASPRAGIFLGKAARALAFLEGRGYVLPDDVRALGHDVLRHRIGLTYEAEAEEITAENIIDDIFNAVEVP